MTIRREVATMAVQMEAQLLANDHKPGWQRDSPESLLLRLTEETGELRKAVYHLKNLVEMSQNFRDTEWESQVRRARDRVAKEAADVANFAMMVTDVCGGLDL